jgi:hypothetical protein
MQRALKIDEVSFGKDHSNVARDINNLAKLLYATNRLSEAEPLSQRATLIFARSLGWEHPNTKTMLENWAIILRELGKQPDVELAKLRARVQGAANAT